MDDYKRPFEFPPLQTHSKRFEMTMIALSIICMIVVLVIVLFTNIGTEFRPKAETAWRCIPYRRRPWTSGRYAYA